MNASDLKAWQAHMSFTYETAAAALGVGRSTYATYLKGANIPRPVGLACAAIASGLGEWSPADPKPRLRRARA